MRTAALIVALLALLVPTARADRVLQEWRFDTPAALDEWSTNNEMAGVRVEGGALSFRCAGSDPILVRKPRFDIPTTPWQAIEIRMRADRDGGIELFWSGNTEGRYGGFSGEKSTPLAVRGDWQWRTLRVYPFWQTEPRIVQLRIDPYYGARFEIAWVRIVDAGGGGAWNLADGVAARGDRLALGASNGFTARAVKADATATPIVSVRASGATGRRASVVFATDASPGLHELSFGLDPGAGERTYNVDMLNSPDWRGHVVAVGIRPGEAAGDALVVRGLQVSARAQGPARLRVLSFTVDEALPRAGAPFSLTARVTNDGGAVARGVRPEVSPAAGIVLRGVAVARDVAYGQEEQWSWTAVCARPMTARFALRAAARGAAAVRAVTGAEVTARIRVRGPLPAPKAVRGPIDVGAYYFPGWRGAAQWGPIMRYPERRPVLGWYREGEPAIADWHVRWAVEHGITFFAYDWYWSQGARSLEHALHQGLFGAKYGRMLQFCLLWANHNADGTSSVADCRAVTRYWIANYFRRPEYYRIGGRPVVIIFSTYRLRADLGSPHVREAMDAMREECRAAGVPPVMLIACIGDAGDARLASDEGYDAVSAYNWPGLGVPSGQRRVPFAELVPAYRRNWESIVRDARIPMMLPICGGWDSRPWHGESALVRTRRDPATFRAHLRDARAFIEANPGRVLPSAIVEAWNELGEGSYIEPQREFGFGYLDAIRDVFTDAPPRHVDLTPADTGVPAPQVEPAQPGRTRWTFERGAGGWTAMMNLSEPVLRAGILRSTTTGVDPAFTGPPMQAQASAFQRIRLRMRLTAEPGARPTDDAQLFWTTGVTGASEAASAHVRVQTDGVWRDVVFPVRANPRWRGIVTGLRLDPCSQTRIRVDIRSIALER